ncbi:N-lysine methyltransferase-like protein [Hapsidospora chrysogenum ATCC 11550]|uniref:Protein-lysine N-methyltransferase EFM4 n=1 Tax=Hapsidospora chrysogenum (strain ATCC 11550 / CBS 779.69 / DSM 880 / IAM 14645 / JCM 23072 / IMI 49137) TaxID=857340 RepID=A0A086SUV6_HAPC1|nr:N-lysine methyltransferase-like protein [Hapsidospora chrysogenum ATCC 11550]
MSAPARPEPLAPSKLGTKEYWDSLYTTEIANNSANPSDIGTVWFDDSDAEAKILDFLASHFPPSILPRSETSFLDLGCGNGSLLFALRDDKQHSDDEKEDDDDDDEQQQQQDKVETQRRGPWTGPLLGVDYSPHSVALARQIASSRNLPHDETISFREWDVLAGPLSTVLAGAQSHGWDVVLDKGTFDAVSLSAETDADGRRPCEGYRDRVLRIVRPGGYFIVTSCNWTEPELRAWFEGAGGEDGGGGGDGFVLDGRVEYQTFSFGGVKGQTITTLCFRKEVRT